MISLYYGFRSFVTARLTVDVVAGDWREALTPRNILAIVLLPRLQRQIEIRWAKLEDRHRLAMMWIDENIATRQRYRQPGDTTLAAARSQQLYVTARESVTLAGEWCDTLDWFRHTPEARRYVFDADADYACRREQAFCAGIEAAFGGLSFSCHGEAQAQE